MDVMDSPVGMSNADPSTQGARILVLERDGGTADAVVAVLRHEGHDVRGAGDGTEAWAALRAGHFDIVLLGLEPDRAAGDALVRAAREAQPEASLILLAGYADLEVALGALRLGIYAYLMKPVDVDELRTTIQRVLERQRLQRALVASRAQERELRARLEREGDETTESLRRRVESLERANQELRESQEQHDRFVAMVAHEMRGPLNPIIAYAQLAQRPALPREKLDSYMQMIVEHAFRLNRLIDDLRTATRLSTGQFSLRLERMDVCGAVAEVVDQFVASVHERRFTLDLPPEVVYAEADRDRIVQAVRNLVDNAVKYSAEGGAIDIRVWGEDARAHISVADFGVGLTEQEIRQIGLPFVRGNASHEVAGSGLGLYITRGIAEAHRGHLTVRNRAGDQRAQGAIFTIILPLTQEEAPTL